MSDVVLKHAQRENAALHKVLKAARMIFEHDGPVQQTSGDVLRAALTSTSDDLDVINDASHTGLGAADMMVSIRLQNRIKLALELADFFDEFGEAPEEEEAVTA